MKEDTLDYWIGDYGQYRIPPEFAGVPLTKKTRFPDRRFAISARLLEWAAQQEEAARQRLARPD